MGYLTPEGYSINNSKLWFYYKLKNYYFSVATANKGTCWYNNIDSLRYDDIFSISRVYDRKERTYSLEIIIGRLHVAFDQIGVR